MSCRAISDSFKVTRGTNSKTRMRLGATLLWGQSFYQRGKKQEKSRMILFLSLLLAFGHLVLSCLTD